MADPFLDRYFLGGYFTEGYFGERETQAPVTPPAGGGGFDTFLASGYGFRRRKPTQAERRKALALKRKGKVHFDVADDIAILLALT